MQRHLDESLKNHFLNYKQILILLGSRQVGKTTIVKKLFKDARYLLVDNEPIRKILESYDIESYKSLINLDTKNLIIDEIHQLSDPGRAAKIIYDQLEDINLIITGSSSFHIKNKTSESLAGRKIDYKIFPLTFSEFLVQKNIEKILNYNILDNILSKNDLENKSHLFDMEAVLSSVLIYGQYPQNINNPNDEKYLLNFVDSLIFKDILELKLIEDKKLATNLLHILASQIGNLINYSELSSRLRADIRTVRRYIEIFEQSFIIFRLYPYSKNKRNEISKAVKIYFYDNGIRNAILKNFSDFNLREDKGALFENFIISETKKLLSYTNKNYTCYYWRNKQKSEIDLVLEGNDELIGVEIKCKKRFLNKAFKSKYENANLKMITLDNFY